jgi:hypothetical protein
MLIERNGQLRTQFTVAADQFRDAVGRVVGVAGIFTLGAIRRRSFLGSISIFREISGIWEMVLMFSEA